MLQLHVIAFLPPASLAPGAEPTVVAVGGGPRLLLSAAALRSAWRASPLFRAQPTDERALQAASVLQAHRAERREALEELRRSAAALAAALGGIPPEAPVAAVPEDERALFGPVEGEDAASDAGAAQAGAQVGDALSTHVAGAPGLGAGGVFYVHLSVDEAALVRALGGDDAARRRAGSLCGVLAEVACTVAPGKPGAGWRAHYVLAERGAPAPRSLAAAFAEPVSGADVLDASVAALTRCRAGLDAAYGAAPERTAELHVGRHGSLDAIVAFAQG